MEGENSSQQTQLAPWLVFSAHGKRERRTTFFDISDGSYKVRNTPDMRRKICMACYFGWFVMLDDTSQNCFLLNCTSFSKIQLPYPNFCKFSHCVLSSPPTDPDCVIILILSTDSFMYCRPRGDRWIKRKYKVGNEDVTIWQVCCCKEKVYVYTFERRLGIINVEADPAIAWLEAKEPKRLALIQIISYSLVESHGEMFLIRKSHLLPLSQISRFDVYKMDFSRMVWEEVHSLGDLVLFIGNNSSASCSATDSGIEGNCIYFTKQDDKNLYVYSLDRGTISVKFSCQNIRPPWRTPFWAIPTTPIGFEIGSSKQERQQKYLKEVQPEITNPGKEEDMIEIVIANHEDVKYRPWADLPIHLLELIAVRLFRVDFVHMTSVCRSWRSIGHPSLIACSSLSLLPIHDLPLLRNHSPWLMFINKKDGRCNFLDPLHSETYFINILELSGSSLSFSKDGWIFIYGNDRSAFLFNPFIKEKIQVPNLETWNYFQSISFLATPTSPDSLIFTIASILLDDVSISICRRRDNFWVDDDFHNNLRFMAAFSGPIFCDEVFYVLGHGGRLGIFDPMQMSWTVLAKPKPLKFCDCRIMPCKYEYYLVESDGELLMVFVGFLGTSIHVYRLNRSVMEWEEVETLEDRVLFVCRWASFSCRSIVKKARNRIYFPRLCSGQPVFYSLDDRRCHPNSDFFQSEEYIYSTWVEPRWAQPSAEELIW